MQTNVRDQAAKAKTSILLHTRSRKDSLLRTLDYLDGELAGSKLKTIVLDGSREDEWEEFHGDFLKRTYAMPLEIRHRAWETPLLDRLIEGIEQVDTPYVMFGADDDFYAFDWLEEGVAALEADPDIGTVHGHVLFFELENYQAHGRLKRLYVHPRRDPPAVWLEQDDPLERLRTLTTGVEPSVVGWYALQRTDQLRAILEAWRKQDMPWQLAEYLLVVGQAMRKTRMLDRIILARQGNPHANHAHFDVDGHPEGVAALTEACRDLWAQSRPASAESDAAIRRFLDGPIRICRMMNSAAHRRRHALRERFPLLVDIYRKLLGRGDVQISRGFTAYPDPRLPPIPKIDDSHPLVRKIGEATAPR